MARGSEPVKDDDFSRCSVSADREPPEFAVQVRYLYQSEGLSARRIAAVVGVGRRRVEMTLRAAGIAVAPRGAGRARPATGNHDGEPELVARVRHLYQSEGLSTRRIAAAMGVGRGRVEMALREAGIAVAPRGAGRERPTTRDDDPADLGEQLHQLYCIERLSRRQVSEKLGLTDAVVRRRLAQNGIRTRGRYNREDRRDLTDDELITYYRDGGLTAQQAGELLGVSGRILLRAAHDHGVPVRPSASTKRVVGSITLVEALYADPLLRDTLERHKMPIVAAGGPIWQRFPDPVRASADLCVDLYVHCGASISQIELVTGRPALMVRRTLRQAGVTLRASGGRSPLRRRWEEGAQSTSP